MVEAEPRERPPKRARAAERGPDLRVEAFLKYSIKLPHKFSPGAVQANRVALQVQDSHCTAYTASGEYVYEVSVDLGLEPSAPPSGSGGVEVGKEGVLVPRTAQAGHIRQLEPVAMGAEVQGLYSGLQGGCHLLAAVDSVGNARLLATPWGGAEQGSAAAGASGAGDDGEDGTPGRHLMCIDARSRGECGWTGMAVRCLAGPDSGNGAASCSGSGSGIFPPQLEVAIARQRVRDVSVFHDGQLVRALHMAQGPTALTYLPAGVYGGTDASGGLLAVAEEHQVALWDVRQGEHGGCVQRLNVCGGGWPLYALSWVAGAVPGPQGGGASGLGGGLLAATGAERAVVVMEPRKWHVVAKWAGCVKYPATHLVPSVVAPGYVYVAGLDYECAAGRWDGSSGGSAGNQNSSTGGHGRAQGPAQLLREQQQRQEAAAGDGPEGGSRAGLSFRGDSKWLGLASATVSAPGDSGGRPAREVVAALSLSGNLFVLAASAAAPDSETPA